ncbi:hypothetical protein LKR43_01080 [Pusillimonas sp. MFBS29]|uniref:hypothetical protein n=1 Tax=Pusillimonas sp. MFBS29 TaxID=2886690 RepID=UPI001D121BE2|nr:hypothetical protein [Pusillimonas sp. MFBS29]MCC2594926.1 hypothetical protein [Pusillimonas sp. MFBS29]
MSNETLTFTADEIDLIGRTADAMSAYMGKPVLAEIMDAQETGFEWVIFAVPLDIHDSPDDYVVVEIGGPGARFAGNTGGLTMKDGDIFDCEYLWAIQLSDLEGIRFIKVDQNGDEVAWTETLQEILPFIMTDDATAAPEDDDDDEPSEADDPDQPRILH